MSFCETNSNLVLEHELHPETCRALWCAVLQEQFDLALSERASDRFFEIAVAQRWFGTRDFYMVCALAGLDADWVLAGVRYQFQQAGVF